MFDTDHFLAAFIAILVIAVISIIMLIVDKMTRAFRLYRYIQICLNEGDSVDHIIAHLSSYEDVGDIHYCKELVFHVVRGDYVTFKRIFNKPNKL
jgi:hypothetical protein